MGIKSLIKVKNGNSERRRVFKDEFLLFLSFNVPANHSLFDMMFGGVVLSVPVFTVERCHDT